MNITRTSLILIMFPMVIALSGLAKADQLIPINPDIVVQNPSWVYSPSVFNDLDGKGKCGGVRGRYTI